MTSGYRGGAWAEKTACGAPITDTLAPEVRDSTSHSVSLKIHDGTVTKKGVVKE